MNGTKKSDCRSKNNLVVDRLVIDLGCDQIYFSFGIIYVNVTFKLNISSTIMYVPHSNEYVKFDKNIRLYYDMNNH